MSIRYRKDRKSWEVSVNIQGRRQRVSVETKKAGEEFAAAVRLKRAGIEDPTKFYLIRSAFDSFLETESAQKIQKTTRADKRFLDIAAYFLEVNRGLKYVDQVKLEDLQALQIWLKDGQDKPMPKEPWTQTTILRNCKILKAVFRKLIQTERLAKNPAQYWKIPPGQYKQRRPMTRAEFEKLLNGVPLWYVAILRTLRLTGARGASLATLTWANVDFERSRLLLSSRKGGLSQMKMIPIPIFPELHAILVELWNKDPRPGFVFKDDLGRPVSAAAISSIGSRAIKSAGIEGTTLYGLRNSLATDLLDAGVSTDVIRRILGHNSEKQLQVYTGFASLEPLQEAMSLVREEKKEDDE